MSLTASDIEKESPSSGDRDFPKGGELGGPELQATCDLLGGKLGSATDILKGVYSIINAIDQFLLDSGAVDSRTYNSSSSMLHFGLSPCRENLTLMDRDVERNPRGDCQSPPGIGRSSTCVPILRSRQISP